MATKRTPIHRSARRRITPEAVAAFKRAIAVQDVRFECLRGRCTANPKSLSEHCPVCAEYYDAACTLSRALGGRIWEPSPLEVDGPEPPDWSTGGGWHDAWPAAWELRQELDKEAQEAT